MQEPLLVFLLLLLFFTPIYLYTMNPTVSPGDSGEFVAASENLSLPHAPSYPLFSLLGKMSIILNPFAHIAYKVNFLTLFLGILTAALFYFLLLNLKIPILSSLATTLVFLYSSLLWEHSLYTEVFTLNSLFVVLILFFFHFKEEHIPLNQRFLLCIFLTGFGLGNHHTLILIGPLLVLLYFFSRWTDEITPFQAFKDLIQLTPLGLLFFIIGFSVYIYLPIRSLANPPLDWSNPENLKNFIRVITRADYGSLALTLGNEFPRTFDSALFQTARYLSHLTKDITLLGIIIGFYGWFIWWKSSRWRMLSYFIFFILSGIFFLILGNLPFDAQSDGILPRFYLMPAIPFMVALAYCFSSIESGFNRYARLLFLLPLFLLCKNAYAYVDSRHRYVSYDYGKNLFKTLPLGSVLFMDGGDDTFYTLAYLTMAENRRSDLKIHDRGGLIFKNPYGKDFRRITKEQKKARRQTVEESFLGIRPLYYSTLSRKLLLGADMIPTGILYRAHPTSQPITKDLKEKSRWQWKFYSTRGVYTSTKWNYRTRALLALYPYLEGFHEWDLKHIRRALGFGRDIAWLNSNIAWEYSMKAYALSNEGKTDKAIELYEEVIQVAPDFASAYTNLGVLMEKKGNYKSSEDYHKKAIDIDPKYAEAYYNLGVLYWKQERWKEVINMFQKTLRFNPNHPTARNSILMLRQRYPDL